MRHSCEGDDEPIRDGYMEIVPIYQDPELRKKVAALCGWTNFYAFQGRSPEGVEDEPVPSYEMYPDKIMREFEKRGIDYVLRHRNYFIDLKYCAVDLTFSVTADGKTAAIALCRLFLAVMQSIDILESTKNN